jgi:hypothetical protein
MLLLLTSLALTPAFAEDAPAPAVVDATDEAAVLLHWPVLGWKGHLDLNGSGVHSKAVHLKLTIWDAPEGGNPVWNELHSGRTKLKATKGEISFDIGRISSITDGKLLNQSAPNDLWLEVTLMQVDKNASNDVFGPRVPVVTAKPWAFPCTESRVLKGATYTLELSCTPDAGREL